jgi:hypothetical protein
MSTAARSTAEGPIEKQKRRVFPAIFGLAGIALFVALARAADPASVTFSLDFPNSSPEHYVISVQSDGRTHYESSGKISNDSDARDDYQTDFTFSDTTRTQIFDLAKAAHYFSGKVDSGNKKLAFTGSKKLVYSDPQRTSSAEYNFSTVSPVQQLTTLFQNVSGTMEFGRRLTYYHRYQKLALDDELKHMEDQARRGELAELQAVQPVLQQIYDDNSVMNVIRARAQRIMSMAKTVAAASH